MRIENDEKEQANEHLSHPNEGFKQFINDLPAIMQPAFVRHLAATLPLPHGKKWEIMVKNWRIGNAQVPHYLWGNINYEAKKWFFQHLKTTGIVVEPEDYVLNLFKKMAHIPKDKTTVPAERIKIGLNQKGLADEIEISVGQLRKIEKREHYNVQLSVAQKIASYFGREMNEFIEFSEIFESR